MTKVIVLTPGTRIGKFEVVRRAENSTKGDARYVVRCTECGHEYVKRGTDIRKAMRDGCRWVCECDIEKRKIETKARAFDNAAIRQSDIDARKKEAERYRRMKEENILLYYTWKGMKARCYRKTHPKYKHYGMRGIFVCDEWLHDFESFCNWSIEHGYRKGLTIDRRDNDREYSPENSRWTTYGVQNSNRRCSPKYQKVLGAV